MAKAVASKQRRSRSKRISVWRAVPQVVVLVRVVLKVEQFAARVAVIHRQLVAAVADQVARELDQPARSRGAILRAP